MKTYKINDNEYNVSWCDHCGVPVLYCDKCSGTTCNCMSCKECAPDFHDKIEIREFEKKFMEEVKTFNKLMELFPIAEKNVTTEDPALEGVFGKYNRDSLIEKRLVHWNFFKDIIRER